MMTRVQGAVSCKQVLSWLGTGMHPGVRLPLVQANELEKQLIIADLREAGWQL